MGEADRAALAHRDNWRKLCSSVYIEANDTASNCCLQPTLTGQWACAQGALSCGHSFNKDSLRSLPWASPGAGEWTVDGSDQWTLKVFQCPPNGAFRSYLPMSFTHISLISVHNWPSYPAREASALITSPSVLTNVIWGIGFSTPPFSLEECAAMWECEFVWHSYGYVNL